MLSATKENAKQLNLEVRKLIINADFGMELARVQIMETIPRESMLFSSQI